MTRWLALVLVATAIAWIPGCKKDSGDAGDAGTEGDVPCPSDDDNTPDKAGALTLDTPVQGYLCPASDKDHFRFSVPAGMELVSVQLALLDVPLPTLPIQPTYAITNGSGEVAALPEASELATPKQALDVTHSLVPGDYVIAVRDQNNDGQDPRHPYTVTITAAPEPDGNEPNNTAGEATAAAPSSPLQGFISYRGDQDWYKIDLDIRSLLTVDLTMAVGGIDPAFRIVDAAGKDVTAPQGNPAGRREPTNLNYTQSIPAAGSYYVVVFDDDGLQADVLTPYTLSLTVGQDPDTNEPNNTPATATALGTGNCAASSSLSSVGYIGSTGDADWYGVGLSGCARGVVEVEVAFDAPASLPTGLQPAVRLMRPVDGVVCTKDQDCLELPTSSCKLNFDCALYGNTCNQTTQKCAGSGFCLPTGTCGALLMSSDTEPFKSNEQGTINTAAQGATRFAAPVLGLSQLYVVVEDFQGDVFSVTQRYSVNVRTVAEPDGGESYTAFTGKPPRNVEDRDDPTRDDYRAELEAFMDNAAPAAVHNCVAGDCCNDSTWITGYLSYSYDQDWYTYPHPCPDADCVVRIKYDLDAGPVDFIGTITKPNGDNFFDAPVTISDTGVQARITGHRGGVDAGDECVYALLKHKADPYFFYVRDTRSVSEDNPLGGTWDWNTKQAYRYCIEKVADGCVSPCYLYPGGECTLSAK